MYARYVPKSVAPEGLSDRGGIGGVKVPPSTPSSATSTVSSNSSCLNISKHRVPKSTKNRLFLLEILLAFSCEVASSKFLRYVFRFRGACSAQSSVAAAYRSGSCSLARRTFLRMVSWSSNRSIHSRVMRGSEISSVTENVHGPAEHAKGSRATSG